MLVGWLEIAIAAPMKHVTGGFSGAEAEIERRADLLNFAIP